MSFPDRLKTEVVVHTSVDKGHLADVVLLIGTMTRLARYGLMAQVGSQAIVRKAGTAEALSILRMFLCERGVRSQINRLGKVTRVGVISLCSGKAPT